MVVNRTRDTPLDEPTRGIDVGAKFEIYQLMIELANKRKRRYYGVFRNA